jgi:hypothetical protein
LHSAEARSGEATGSKWLDSDARTAVLVIVEMAAVISSKRRRVNNDINIKDLVRVKE